MTENKYADLIKLCQQRVATYSLLSRLYRIEVDQNLFDQLSAMRFPAASGNENTDKGYRLLTTYLSGTTENALTELAVDYVRAFIGHGIDAYSAAYPFESVYTSEKRLLMQEARDEVLAVYRANGLAKQESWKEGEDHIALELEFMQILTNRAIVALEENNEEDAFDIFTTQKTFMEDHLLSWVPMMTADLKRFAHTGLYQSLAYMTDGFLTTDYEFLEDLLSSEEEQE